MIGGSGCRGGGREETLYRLPAPPGARAAVAWRVAAWLALGAADGGWLARSYMARRVGLAGAAGQPLAGAAVVPGPLAARRLPGRRGGRRRHGAVRGIAARRAAARAGGRAAAAREPRAAVRTAAGDRLDPRLRQGAGAGGRRAGGGGGRRG